MVPCSLAPFVPNSELRSNKTLSSLRSIDDRARFLDFPREGGYTQHAMSPLVSQVSKALHVRPSVLIHDGLLSYVEREIRLAEEDIADLREKYLADSRRALLKKIKSKKVASHPAWEDLITWENLEAHLRTLH